MGNLRGRTWNLAERSVPGRRHAGLIVFLSSILFESLGSDMTVNPDGEFFGHDVRYRSFFTKALVNHLGLLSDWYNVSGVKEKRPPCCMDPLYPVPQNTHSNS